ncbi:Zinc finger CCHC-type [Gracilaria domingensis]|nr:Zinc finger CCHC-type [Gracilaria domingensis]
MSEAPETPRSRRGGPRSNAGRPRSEARSSRRQLRTAGPSTRSRTSVVNEIREPDTERMVEGVDVPLEPHNPEELYMSSSSTGIPSDTDQTVMRNAAKPRRDIHSHTHYVWDANAESIRLGRASSSRNPEHQLIPNSLPSCCGKCGNSGHRSSGCPLKDFGWVLRIRCANSAEQLF